MSASAASGDMSVRVSTGSMSQRIDAESPNISPDQLAKAEKTNKFGTRAIDDAANSPKPSKASIEATDETNLEKVDPKTVPAEKKEGFFAKLRQRMSIRSILTMAVVGLAGIALLLASPFCPPLAAIGVGFLLMSVMGLVMTDESERKKGKEGEETNAAAASPTPIKNKEEEVKDLDSEISKLDNRIRQNETKMDRYKTPLKDNKEKLLQLENSINSMRREAEAQKLDPHKNKDFKNLSKQHDKLEAEVKEQSECFNQIQNDRAQMYKLGIQKKELTSGLKRDLREDMKKNLENIKEAKQKIDAFNNGEQGQRLKAIEGILQDNPSEKEIDNLKNEHAHLERQLYALEQEYSSLIDKQVRLKEEARNINLGPKPLPKPNPQNAQEPEVHPADLFGIESNEDADNLINNLNEGYTPKALSAGNDDDEDGMSVEDAISQLENDESFVDAPLKPKTIYGTPPGTPGDSPNVSDDEGDTSKL